MELQDNGTWTGLVLLQEVKGHWSGAVSGTEEFSKLSLRYLRRS